MADFARLEEILKITLKDAQRDVIMASIAGDTFAVLPTGYGKTAIIKALPYIGETVVLVVSPLTCILEQQLQEFGSAAYRLSLEIPMSESVIKERLLQTDLRFILGHPEEFTDPVVKRCIMTYLNDKVSHIAVDEAHVVLSWGKEDFRPAFSKLASLRACIPGAKVIALTASANLHSRNMIAKVLGMRNTQHIVRSPNRSNIYMCVLARPENYGEEGIDRIIDPILTKLKLQEQHFERTVIYASLKWCGYIHRRAVMHHGIIAGQLIAQYHAPQTQEMKTFICSDMSVKSGNLRLLLATEAYGMGADCSNLRHVIHIGPPNTLETYIQEIGRVGRDGLPSFSTIFYNKSDISRNKAHLHQTMKDFLLTNNCRRQTMLAHFDFENEIQTSSCCDNCKAQSLLIDSSQACKVARKRLDLVKKEKCRISLQKYFQISNSQHSDVCIPAMVTGLCDQVLETVMKGVESYGSYAKLRESFPGIKDVHLINISNIISKIVET